MSKRPITQKGYKLLHDGVVELSRVEANGIRIDTDHLEWLMGELKGRIRSAKQKLMEDEEIWPLWKKRFQAKAKITSRDQFGSILFEDLGYEPTELTEKENKPKMDAENLGKVKAEGAVADFIKTYSRMMQYDQALGTFVKGINKETVNGRLHPVFNLHTARSYRSSSDSPNFQNFPVRDKEIGDLVRRCFIPSKGCVLVENDFKGIEVVVSASYHKDENFISYITTPGKDMHRDMAAQIFKLETGDVSKDIRHAAKNCFVFPQFYGDFYIPCARNLWDRMVRGKLKTPDGVPLRKHLKRKGIKKLGELDPEGDPRPGTFEKHLQEVENDFWNNRFMAYGQWRKKWYKNYLEKGFFDLRTGFRVHGSHRRNSAVNYPIQGSAFHCLLWCLIRINRLLRKYKMKSKVVGQIHDSVIGDVRVSELRDYLEIVQQVTTRDVMEHYKWLIVPLEIEYEIAVDSWNNKQEFVFDSGRFYHPDKPKKYTQDAKKFVNIMKKKGLKE